MELKLIHARREVGDAHVLIVPFMELKLVRLAMVAMIPTS